MAKITTTPKIGDGKEIDVHGLKLWHTYRTTVSVRCKFCGQVDWFFADEAAGIQCGCKEGCKPDLLMRVTDKRTEWVPDPGQDNPEQFM